MPDIPNEPVNKDGQDDQADLQGYQDDFDTSKRDQATNEALDNQADNTPATRAEFAQGLRDSTAPDQEGGTNPPLGQDDPEPPMASQDDYREDIEDRDEDDKERSLPGWQ